MTIYEQTQSSLLFFFPLHSGPTHVRRGRVWRGWRADAGLCDAAGRQPAVPDVLPSAEHRGADPVK